MIAPLAPAGTTVEPPVEVVVVLPPFLTLLKSAIFLLFKAICCSINSFSALIEFLYSLEYSERFFCSSLTLARAVFNLSWASVYLSVILVNSEVSLADSLEDLAELFSASSRALTFLTIIGSIFLLVSQTFMRCKEIYEEQNKPVFFRQN